MADDRPDSKRLVVEMSAAARDALAHVVAADEMNRTTVVNRALRLYRLVSDAERTGGAIYLRESPDDDLQRLRLL